MIEFFSFFLSSFLRELVLVTPLIAVSSLVDYVPVLLTFTINDNRRLSIDQDIDNMESYDDGEGLADDRLW